MARILFFVAMLALTIYAAADWHRTPEDEMPGKLPKPIWLLIILFTATISRPSAPDDDPEFLFRLERDIQRKRREEERRKRERGEDASDGDATGSDS